MNTLTPLEALRPAGDRGDNRRDEWLARLCKEWRQPGLALAIASSDSIQFAGGAGVRKVGGGDPVDRSTLFAAASISKTFAAATVGVLADRGELSLDDRVKRFLPHFRLADPWVSEEIRVRDLLCNRIGLESSEGRHRRCASSKKDLIARMEKQHFRHPFRAAYGYCSDAFTCAGAIVEAVSGLDWETFARQTIWGPLGMTRTNADHKKSRGSPNAASPHLMTDAAPTPITWAYEEAAATPAGGVNSCAEDLAIWLQTLLSGGALNNQRVLSEDMLNELLTPHTAERGAYREDEMACVVGGGPNGIEAPSYALGWYRHSYRGATVCYHTGSIDGFRSIIGMLPDHDFGVAVLANADNPYLPRALLQSLIDERLGYGDRNWLAEFHRRQESAKLEADRQAQQSGPERTDARCPVSLDSLCGEYRDETGFGDARVMLKAGQLVLEVGETSYDLVHWGGLSFAGYRRPPYAGLQQFFASWSLDERRRPLRFSTTQDALFEYCN